MEESNNYHPIINDVLNSKNLSFKAKGIYIVCCQVFKNKPFILSDLFKISKESHTAMRSGLKELFNNEYLFKVKTTIGGKFSDTLYCTTSPNNIDFITIDSGKKDQTVLYAITLCSDVEEFIKIGVCEDVNIRFSAFRNAGYYPYLISTIKFKNKLAAQVKEKLLHQKFKKYKYNPLIKFNGHTECFNVECRTEVYSAFNK